jgi:hypothetical protein
VVSQSLLEFVRPVLKGTRRDICLATLYHVHYARSVECCTASELKAVLVEARIPKARSFNVGDVLGKSGHLASASRPSGAKANLWRLTKSGEIHVRTTLTIESTAAEIEVKNDISVMDSVIRNVADPVVRGYLEESVLAYSVGALRAAVVFLWSGAIRQLQEKSLLAGIPTLNSALVRHDPKARHVGKIEDFSGVRDVTQLLAFRDIGIIDKGEWTTLSEGLDLRNRCGHPTKYTPGIKKVSAFIEDTVGISF